MFKDKHFRSVVQALLLMTILFVGCEAEEPPELRYFENPENIFPCWRQSWKDGDWMPLDGNPDPTTYFETKSGKYGIRDIEHKENNFYLSLCVQALSTRIIDPVNKTERIIEHFLMKDAKVKNEWTVAVSRTINDLIRKDDILFILYKSRMYAVLIDKIYDSSDPDESVTRIKVANIITLSEANGKIDLNKLKWKKKKVSGAIDLADRYVSFGRSSDMTGEKVLLFRYDHCYGDSKTLFPPEYPNTEPAHIAIVDKEYLKDNEIVDLTKFRFKTWEDGLGNRCD